MVTRVSFLLISLASCFIAVGCECRADKISESHGIAGVPTFCDCQAGQKLATLIESGQADQMLAEGKAKISTREIVTKHAGKALVIEYSIQGDVYKTEVHYQINPREDVLTTNMRRIEYGPVDRAMFIVNPWQMADVLLCLQNDSYDGKADVAYRAWRGSDGVVHPVRVIHTETPDWSSSNPIDLYLRTDAWPMAAIAIQGMRPEGRGKCGMPPKPDGRWVVQSSGPAVPTRAFINNKLDGLLRLVAASQAYDVAILDVPSGM